MNYKLLVEARGYLLVIFTCIVFTNLFAQESISFINPTGYDISRATYAGVDQEFYVGDRATNPTSLVFSPDGMHMFIAGQPHVFQYSLSTPFDVSTASFYAEYDFGPFNMTDISISFNDTGSQLFMHGQYESFIIALDLSSPYDITTVSNTASFENSISCSTEFRFNADGTKIYFLCREEIYQYELSEAYDLTTLDYETIVTHDITQAVSSGTSFQFSQDGSLLFVTGSSRDAVSKYELGTPFDLATAVYSGILEDFCFKGQETFSQSMAFNSDGTKMFILGKDDDYVVEYDLPIGSIADENVAISEVLLDIDADAGQGLDEGIAYTLTGDDSSSFSISSTGEISFVNPPDFENPQDADFDNSYSLNVTASTGVETKSLDLTIDINDLPEVPSFVSPRGFDIEQARYLGKNEEFFLVEDPAVDGMIFNDTGTKMYIADHGSDYRILVYDLATAYDVSTASYVSEMPISHRLHAIRFNNNGTILYVLNSEVIEEYQLSQAYDLSSATHLKSTAIPVDIVAPIELNFSADGLRYFILDIQDNIWQFQLSEAFNLATASLSCSLNVRSYEDETQTFIFTPDGSSLFVLGHDKRRVVEYKLARPFDVFTATVAPFSLYIFDQSSYPRALAFSKYGGKMFVYARNIDSVVEYAIPVLGAEISEEILPGDMIIDVDAIDGAGGEEDEQLTYALSGNDASVFEMNAGTGEISFGEAPDFEDPSDANSDNVYALTAHATSATGTTSIDLTITVGDVNEEPLPAFLSPTVYNVRDILVDYENNYPYLDISNIQTNASGLLLDPSGTKMFVSDVSNSSIAEFSLATNFDITTASHTGLAESLSMKGLVDNPTDLAFNGDGTKLFVSDYYARTISEFQLTKAYDISTGTFSGESQALNLDSLDSRMNLFSFFDNGNGVIVGGGFNPGTLTSLSLTNPYDLSTAEYVQSVELSMMSNPQEIYIDETGKRMFILGDGGSYYSPNALAEFSLGSAFDISTLAYTGQTFYLTDQDGRTDPMSYHISAHNLMALQRGVVTEYPLKDFTYSRSENIATTSIILNADAISSKEQLIDDGITYTLSGVDADKFDIDSNTGELSFRQSPDFEEPADTDLDNAYELTIVASNEYGSSEKSVRIEIQNESESPQFLPGSRLNLSKAVYLGDEERLAIEPTNSTIPTDIFFSNDGLKMMVLVGIDREVREYALEIPFDVSTGVLTHELELIGLIYDGDIDPSGFTFSDDGTKMYIVDREYRVIMPYVLDEPFSLKSAQSLGENSLFYITNVFYPNDIKLTGDGRELFLLDDDDRIISYHLSTAFDVTTAERNESEGFELSEDGARIVNFNFSKDGKQLFIIDRFGDLKDYLLKTAYDLSSARYQGNTRDYPFSDVVGFPAALTFNSSESKLFVIGNDQRAIYEFDLPRWFELEEKNDENAILTDLDAVRKLKEQPDDGITYRLSGPDQSLFNLNTETGELVLVSILDYENPSDANADGLLEVVVEADNGVEVTGLSIWVSIENINEIPLYLSPASFNMEEASLEHALDLGYSAEIRSLAFNEDGTEQFVLFYEDWKVISYSLTSPFHIVGATYKNELDLSALHNKNYSSFNAMQFNEEGTMLFLSNLDGPGIHSYAVEEAFNIASAGFDGLQDSLDLSDRIDYAVADFEFNTDGSKLFVIQDEDVILTYQLGEPYDLSTAAYAGNAYDLVIADYLDRSVSAMAFDYWGKQLFLLDPISRQVLAIELEEAYDLSTASEQASDTLDYGDDESYAFDFAFNFNGTKLFVLGESDNIFQYALPIKLAIEENIDTDSLLTDTDTILEKGGTVDGNTTYTLGGLDGDLFEIESTTGYLTIKEIPDFETPSDSNSDNIYEFIIFATSDGGSSELEMKVSITDIDEPLSILKTAEFIIYPNPFSDHLNIQASEVYNVKLHDLNGKEMDVTFHEGRLDISLVDSGTYLLKLYDSTGVLIATRKIVKR